MISIDEAWNIIEDINNEAHSCAWDSWIAADEMDDEEAEEQRDAASLEQREYFQEMFNNLDEQTQEDIIQHAKNDPDFRDQFECYYGELE